jgi:HD superfamily phosphohydrolase YqeK
MQQGPDALRAIAASCLELAKAAPDDEERALLVSYATAYHDLALQLEQLASAEKAARTDSERALRPRGR